MKPLYTENVPYLRAYDPPLRVLILDALNPETIVHSRKVTNRAVQDNETKQWIMKKACE